jgi:uncharacterized protein (TIGR02145 family)
MKSIISLTATLALAITLTLTACDEKKKQDGTTTTEPVAATPTQEAAAEVAEKPAENTGGGDTQGGCPNAVTGNGTLTCGGQTYKTVKIGGQVWMAENLNYKPNTGNSWCYGEGGKVYIGNSIYDTLSNAEIQANCAKYGRLYDVETAKTVCPAGWKLPSAADWEKFPQIAGGKSYKECGENGCDEGYKVVWKDTGKKLKAKSGWNENKNGTDDLGFSALPGGYRFPDADILYWAAGRSGSWRMADGHGYEIDDDDRFYPIDYAEGYDSDNFSYSVRCIKD